MTDVTTPAFVIGPDATIGVVGAGAMGTGIAQVALAHGHRVLLTDAHAPALPKARAAIEKAIAREVEKGRLDAARGSTASERLTTIDPADGLAPFGDARFVIEAIIERLDIKQGTFQALERVTAPDAILATNTSSLSIASVAAACERPERVLGVHFFNPAPVLPLVEIVAGVRTLSAAASGAHALVASWGKSPVYASDTPGFIVNRIARPYYGEALRLAEEGVASPATIDWAMKTFGGFRMGPFELMDFIGHDVNYVVTETVWTALYYDPRYRPSIMQKRLLEASLLGRKSGRGFYDYAAGAAAAEPDTDDALGARIFERVIAMLINEAVDAVHLNVARAEAIEVAMTKGVNYPKGLLAWGNELGLDRILRVIDGLRDEYGEDRYRASPLLRRMVREGRRFFE